MLYFGGGFSINEQRNNGCLCIQKTLKHGRKMLDEYFRQYGVIAVFAALAVAVPTGMLLISWFLSVLGIRPKNPSSVKNSIYECGFETITEKWSNFNFRYYSIALLFVIFDVEVIFLFPWAASFGTMSAEFGLYVLAEMLIFIGILVLGWAYAWKKGSLEWS
jgi:NADH-quinone oxidoreductase subunit A